MAAVKKNVKTTIKTEEKNETDAAAVPNEVENEDYSDMIVSDSEEDDEFDEDDISSCEEGDFDKEDDEAMVILVKKIKEMEQCRKLRMEHPLAQHPKPKSRPDMTGKSPLAYFDQYMQGRKLRLMHNKLKFTRGVIRRYGKKDRKSFSSSAYARLHRAEAILGRLAATVKNEPYPYTPDRNNQPLKERIQNWDKLSIRCKNRLIASAVKHVQGAEKANESEDPAVKKEFSEVNENDDEDFNSSEWRQKVLPLYQEIIDKYGSKPIVKGPNYMKEYKARKKALIEKRRLELNAKQIVQAGRFVKLAAENHEKPLTYLKEEKLKRSFVILHKAYPMVPYAPPKEIKVQPEKKAPVKPTVAPAPANTTNQAKHVPNKRANNGWSAGPQSKIQRGSNPRGNPMDTLDLARTFLQTLNQMNTNKSSYDNNSGNTGGNWSGGNRQLSSGNDWNPGNNSNTNEFTGGNRPGFNNFQSNFKSNSNYNSGTNFKTGNYNSGGGTNFNSGNYGTSLSSFSSGSNFQSAGGNYGSSSGGSNFSTGGNFNSGGNFSSGGGNFSSGGGNFNSANRNSLGSFNNGNSGVGVGGGSGNLGWSGQPNRGNNMNRGVGMMGNTGGSTFSDEQLFTRNRRF